MQLLDTVVRPIDNARGLEGDRRAFAGRRQVGKPHHVHELPPAAGNQPLEIGGSLEIRE
jgi:hypothetical protein